MIDNPTHGFLVIASNNGYYGLAMARLRNLLYYDHTIPLNGARPVGIRGGRIGWLNFKIPVFDVRFRLDIPTQHHAVEVLGVNVHHRNIGLVVGRTLRITTVVPERIQEVRIIGLYPDFVAAIGEFDEGRTSHRLQILNLEHLITTADLDALPPPPAAPAAA